MPLAEWRLIYEEQDRVRSNLERVRAQRETAKDLAIRAAGDLEGAVIDAEGWLAVTEIARLAGVSRQTVYGILAGLAEVLD